MYKEYNTDYIEAKELYDDLPLVLSFRVVRFLKDEYSYSGGTMIDALHFCDIIESEFINCTEICDEVTKMREHLDKNTNIKWVLLE